MQRFSETSSIFALDNVKKRSNSARHPHFLSWQHQKQSNSARLPSKMKMQPLSGNQRPDLPTALMKMSLVLRLPRKMIFADPLQMSYAACHRFWTCYKTLTFCSLLTRCTIPCTCHAKRHLNVQVVRACGVLYILTWKRASRHNGVHFFDISTSKSALNGKCFLTFSLRNVLRATTACTFSTSQNPKAVQSWCASRHNAFTFSTSQLQKVLRTCGAFSFFISTSQLRKVVRTWCVLYILTSKSSRHNGVHFFLITHLPSGLGT